jgi:hypothetical protein
MFPESTGQIDLLSLRRSLVPVPESFDHGHEPRAEEIALHQRFLTLLAQIEAAALEGDEREVKRLRPLLDRARKRWIAANMRVTRGG